MDLPRNIQLAEYSGEKIYALWEIVRQFPSIFADGLKDPEEFAARLLAEDSLVFETDGGLVLVEKIRPRRCAEFHATFWDHRLSVRTEELRDLLMWLFATLELERLETYVASYARAVRRFLTQRLGFVYEGTKRRAFLNQGTWHDLEIYSILRTEVLYGPK